jgi:hypothetical protein
LKYGYKLNYNPGDFIICGYLTIIINLVSMDSEIYLKEALHHSRLDDIFNVKPKIQDGENDK